jgi:hypothetical protein
MCNPLILFWLPSADSNHGPDGYRQPDISTRPGLSHHPRLYVRVSGAVRLIGRGPHPLVSARSCLLLSPFGRLRSGLPYHLRDLGFPEFTRFFNRSFLRKLHTSVNFTMTVSAEHYAFIEYFTNLLPASCTTTAGNTEVLQV